MEQTLLVQDGLNKGILHEYEMQNPPCGEISTWYLVGVSLSDALAEKGETILRGSCGTWWGVKNQNKPYAKCTTVLTDICLDIQKMAA